MVGAGFSCDAQLSKGAGDEAQNMMGNASSQPCPPSTGQGRSGQNRKSSDPGNDKRRRYSYQIEPQDGEEGCAQVSMHLKESRPRTPESLQDYATVSAQLVAESSSAPASWNMDAPSSRHLPCPTKQGKKSHKRRSSVLQPSPDAGNMQASLKKVSPEGPLKLDNVSSLDGIMENGLGTPNATCSLDDIDENEEGLSSLFQEYETEATQHISPVPHSPTYSADEVFFFDQDAIDPVLTNQSSKKKRKGKRKRRSSSSALGVGAEQEHLSGTGQHAFDIDFDAFDEIFADEGMQLANPFNEKSGHDLPNGTEPFGERLPLVRAEEDHPSSWDGDPTQEDQRTGVLPSMASARHPHKRKRTEVPNSLDSQIPTYVSSYPPNAGQQDRVLPGIEDIQVGSSSEIPFSHPPGPRNRASCSPTHPSPDPTPPPRLEKPSKPRGNKKQRGGKKGKEYNPPLQEMSEKGGIFSDKEVKVLDSFRDRYCEENNESHRRFNELIQSNVRGNPEVTRLFRAIHDIMPYRTRQSVMRFCRRHFHNFAARGIWSKADDIALKDAVAKKGNSWKAVGAMIDRFPEDCRDRYRNYLVNAEKRKTETWVPEEIRSLVRAVDFCMQLLREQRLRAKEEKYEGRDMPESASESDQEIQDMKLINWQVVSDRMGGTRSRLQCSYKWNHLKNADREEYLREIRRLEKGKSSRSKGTSGSWRLRRAMKKLKNIKSGDKYDILQAFADCGAATESDIPWKSLGSKEFRERWSAMDLKAALKLFKGQVPGSDMMNYQEVVNRVYTRLMADDPSGFDDRWNPGNDGDVNEVKKSGSRKEQDEQNRALRNGSKRERVQADEARRLRLKRKSGEEPKIKSTLFVGSDDEEESEEDRSRASHKGDEDEERTFSPNVADSVEEQSHSCASHERSMSDKGKGEDYFSYVPSIATTEENHDTAPDASPCPVRARVPPPRPKGDETSSDESDDSLFNEEDGVGSELVDQLQLLRDA
ncbi:MAG: hypothetical protein Q9188_006939 [Gyalolechia gomerana]